MATIGSLRVELLASTSGFARTMNDVEKRLSSVSKTAGQIGRALTVGVSLPLAGVALAATKMSMDFNKSMANVATLIPDSTRRVEELKDAVQDLAIETGKSTGDLADGLYQVISAFGDSADSVAALETAARAATAGVATTTDAINLISAVTKGYGDTSLKAQRKVSDLAFQTVKLGQTTFPELASSIGRVTPLAANLGISMEEMFAVMATGTGVTGTASEVSTQLRGILQSLMAPTESMAALLENMGVESGQAAIEQMGLMGVIRKVVGAADAAGAPLQDLISSIEGQTLALALTGPQADVYVQKLQEMAVANGATDEAFREQTEGVNKAGFAWQKAQQRVAVMAQELGDALAPALLDVLDMAEPLLEWLQGAITWFNKLDPGVKKAIVVFGALLAAIGPVLAAFAAIVGVVTTLTPVITALAPVFAALTGPVGLVVVGVLAAVAAGKALIENWDAVKASAQKVWAGIQAVVTNHVNRIIRLLNKIPGVNIKLLNSDSTSASYGQSFSGMQAGGILPGISGPDQYPALLAPGEAVVPSAAVRGGVGAVVEWFRSMGVPGFAEGGIVPGNDLQAKWLPIVRGWPEWPEGKHLPAGDMTDEFREWVEGFLARFEGAQELTNEIWATRLALVPRVRDFVQRQWLEPMGISYSDFLEKLFVEFDPSEIVATNFDFMNELPRKGAALISRGAKLAENLASLDAVRDSKIPFVSGLVAAHQAAAQGVRRKGQGMLAAQLEPLLRHGLFVQPEDVIDPDINTLGFYDLRTRDITYKFDEVTPWVVAHERMHAAQHRWLGDLMEPVSTYQLLQGLLQRGYADPYQSTFPEIEASGLTGSMYLLFALADQFNKELAMLDPQLAAEMQRVVQLHQRTKDQPTRYQSGTILPGISGPDQYPAMLAPGEAVVPSAVVRGGLDTVVGWFRRMGVPGFAEGGIVPGGAPISMDTSDWPMVRLWEQDNWPAETPGDWEFYKQLLSRWRGQELFEQIIGRRTALVNEVMDFFRTEWLGRHDVRYADFVDALFKRFAPSDVVLAGMNWQPVSEAAPWLPRSGAVVGSAIKYHEWFKDEIDTQQSNDWGLSSSWNTKPSPLEALTAMERSQVPFVGLLGVAHKRVLEGLNEKAKGTIIANLDALRRHGLFPNPKDSVDTTRSPGGLSGGFYAEDDWIDYYGGFPPPNMVAHEEMHRAQLHWIRDPKTYELFGTWQDITAWADYGSTNWYQHQLWEIEGDRVERFVRTMLGLIKSRWEYAELTKEIDRLDPELAKVLHEAQTSQFFGAYTYNRDNYQTGGILPGYGGGDQIPALLEAGEAVIPKESVARYRDLIAGLIAGRVPGFQTGGIVPDGPGGWTTTGPGTSALPAYTTPYQEAIDFLDELNAAYEVQTGAVQQLQESTQKYIDTITVDPGTNWLERWTLPDMLTELDKAAKPLIKDAETLRKRWEKLQQLPGVSREFETQSAMVQFGTPEWRTQLAEVLPGIPYGREALAALQAGQFTQEVPVPTEGMAQWITEMEERTRSYSSAIEQAKGAGRDIVDPIQWAAQGFGFIAQVLQRINPVAALFAALLETVAPVIETLMVPIEIVAAALGEALAPVIQALFPVFVALGQVILSVLQFVAPVFNAITSILHGLFSILSEIPLIGNLFKPWRDAFGDMKIDTDGLADAQKKLAELTWEEAEATAAATAAMLNVPQGFKVALARFEVSEPANINIPGMWTGGHVTAPGMALVGERGPELVSLPRGASVVPLEQGSSNGGGEQPGTVSIGPVTIVSNDPEEIWRQLKRLMERDNVRDNGGILMPAPRFV